MNCIILFRWDNGKLAYITGEDDEPREFNDPGEAFVFAECSQLLLGKNYQIVELDEI